MDSKTDVESTNKDETNVPMVQPSQSRNHKSTGEKEPPWTKIISIAVAVIVGVSILIAVIYHLTSGSSGHDSITDSGTGIPKNGKFSDSGLKIIGLPDNSEIRFNPGDPSSYENYVNSLNKFIEPYENAALKGKVVSCEEKAPKDDEVCSFQAISLDTCSRNKMWGFRNSAPCVLVTYDNDETPDVYQSVQELPDDMPDDLKEVILDSDEEFHKIVWLYCINGIAYAPIQGFSPYYFPRQDSDDYLPPLVAITFDLTRSSKVDVECSIWSKATGKADPIRFTIRKNGA